MKNVSKILLVISMLFLVSVIVMTVIPAFEKTRRTILLNLNTKGSLVLDESSLADRVRRHDTIMWIKNDSEIKEFTIAPKRHQGNIFTSDIPKQPNTTVELVVKNVTHLLGGEWAYSITWKDKYGNDHPVDPKIPVKPIIGAGSTPFLIFLTMLFSLLAALSYRRDWLHVINQRGENKD